MAKFDLDAAYKAARPEPFEFSWAGQDWVLPYFGDIDWRALGLADDLKTLADADADRMAEADIEVLQKFFEFGFGTEQAERWAKAPQNMTAMIALFGAWQKHSGTSMGESSASTGSSTETTERPSQRTSRTTTASGSRKRSSGARKSAGAPASS